MYGGSGDTIFSDEKFGGRFECAVGRLNLSCQQKSLIGTNSLLL